MRLSGSQHPGENIVSVAELAVERIREVIQLRRSHRGAVHPEWIAHHHELRGLLYGKHLQQDRINQAEDRGIGANPQRQRENSHRSKSRRLAHHAQAVTEVLNEGVHRQ